VDLEIRSLDRRRLKEAWFCYKLQLFMAGIDDTKSLSGLDPKFTDEFIKKKINLLVKNFTKKWAGIHNNFCEIKNCTKTSRILSLFCFLLNF